MRLASPLTQIGDVQPLVRETYSTCVRTVHSAYEVMALSCRSSFLRPDEPVGYRLINSRCLHHRSVRHAVQLVDVANVHMCM